jgi:hypothetical protein
MLGKIGSFIGIGFVILLVIGFFADDESEEVTVVNLDIVLDEFIAAAKAMPEVEGDTANEMSEEMGSLFLKKYTTKLNEKSALEGKPVGVGMAKDGSFVGFHDVDENGEKGTDESAVFQVEVDEERSRLIATDLENSYHRDSSYRAGSGFLTGFLVSRMLFGQRSAGVSPSKFKNMKMSPKGYHASAKSSVKASRSARSSGKSGSFRSGK